MSLPMLMRERKSWWNCGISMSWNTSKICLNKVRLPVFPSVNNVSTWSTFFQQCLRINKTHVWIIRFGILNLHITVLIYKHLFFKQYSCISILRELPVLSGVCTLSSCLCSFIADCQIPEACYTFVNEHGEAMVKKNLAKNFLIHMVNLFDFSLIRPDVVHKTMRMLDEVEDCIQRSWDFF